MIITRTPFRVTLGGGGTDLPSYYEKHGGFVFSVGIDKYMVVTVNRSMLDDLIRLKYSKTEVVGKLSELKHNIAREALRFTGIDKAIEVNSIADISAGTGLGSSSSYTVGLLHALHTLKRDYVTPQELAEEDFKIEREILGRPIGKQDPYLAAFGGMFVMEIATDGKVAYRRANVSDGTADDLNRNLMIFFTGKTRSADEILKEQEAGVDKEVDQKKREVTESLHYIKQIGYEILEAVEDGNLDKIGKLFDAHWQHKKHTSSKMTNPEFDKIYALAKESGALGGKISGAGGGGFFTFYVPENHAQFTQTMEKLGLRHMRYRFDFEGSKVLVNT